MTRSCHPFLLLVAVALVLVGCGKSEGPLDSGGGLTQATIPSGPSTSDSVMHDVALMAGQTFDAGVVSCWVDGNILSVRYETAGGWMLAETHLAIAAALDGIPRTRMGNPIVGHFPLHSEHNPPASSHTHTIDLHAWELADADELFVAAHAEVGLYSGGELVQEESAWGEGERFPPIQQNGRIKRKLNWAMYFVLDMRALGVLLMWNKLGSAHEVENSEVGPDGIIVGDVEYLPCKHGYGMKPLPRTGDHNIPDNFIDFEGLGLGNQGCIEFWYLPDYINPSVGHVVDILAYGVEQDWRNLHIITHFNDWQNLMCEDFANSDRTAWVGMGKAPAAIPGWSTTEPFHVAFTWDGTDPVINDRLKLFVNGQRVMGSYSHRGDPTLDDWLPDAVLRLASRLLSGDWDRHPWEGDHAIIDNVKVWNYPKTDFSDRFTE